jgi:hypothetical protein
MLRRIFGGWRKLYIQELHNLYTSTNVIRMYKLRRIKWEGDVACMVEVRYAY